MSRSFPISIAPMTDEQRAHMRKALESVPAVESLLGYALLYSIRVGDEGSHISMVIQRIMDMYEAEQDLEQLKAKHVS